MLGCPSTIFEVGVVGLLFFIGVVEGLLEKGYQIERAFTRKGPFVTITSYDYARQSCHSHKQTKLARQMGEFISTCVV